MEHRSTDERRTQIEHAMLRVMAEHGYEKATIAKIAAEAGLTAGLLHYHFQSKQQILLALLDRLAKTELAALQSEGAAPARLQRVVDRLLAAGEHARPQIVAAWVVVGAEAIRQPLVRDRFQETLRELAGIVTVIIEEGTEAGDWQPTRPIEEIVSAFIALVQGYYTLAATARSLVPRSSAAPAARALLQTLLKGDS